MGTQSAQSNKGLGLYFILKTQVQDFCADFKKDFNTLRTGQIRVTSPQCVKCRVQGLQQ